MRARARRPGSASRGGSGVTARPYWVEFPGSGADKGDPYCRSHNAVSLERALSDARQVLWFRWKANHEWIYLQADVAVITNRDTGYRWILRRDSGAVEFQTPEMLAEQVASDQLNVFLSVEEAEALADAAESAEVTDRRTAAVVRQAAGQLRLLASQVREARRQAETHVDWYAELSVTCGVPSGSVHRGTWRKPRPRLPGCASC